jgi:hypothetical protein
MTQRSRSLLVPIAAATCVLVVAAAWLPGAGARAAVAAADPPPTAVIEGRLWATATNGADVPWAEADAYCRRSRLAGRDDWRLPTLDELGTLHDPAPDGSGIKPPVRLDACCLWSSTSLAERPDEQGSAPGGAPALYFWGIVFDGGIRYYSNRAFADGRALCISQEGS